MQNLHLVCKTPPPQSNGFVTACFKFKQNENAKSRLDFVEMWRSYDYLVQYLCFKPWLNVQAPNTFISKCNDKRKGDLLLSAPAKRTKECKSTRISSLFALEVTPQKSVYFGDFCGCDLIIFDNDFQRGFVFLYVFENRKKDATQICSMYLQGLLNAEISAMGVM